MKSIGNHAKAGNANLKGKKFKLLSCKCCAVRDLRSKEQAKQVKKEMRYEETNPNGVSLS
jgi:hypothetical protein